MSARASAVYTPKEGVVKKQMRYIKVAPNVSDDRDDQVADDGNSRTTAWTSRRELRKKLRSIVSQRQHLEAQLDPIPRDIRIENMPWWGAPEQERISLSNTPRRIL